MKHSITKVYTIEPNIALDSDEEDLPVSDRQCRDVFFTLLFIAFLSFLSYVILEAALVKRSNPNLVIHGYDNYGNICGQPNVRLPNVSQSGQNMTGKPFLLIELKQNVSLRTKCVAKCPEKDFYVIAFYRCLPIDSRLPLLIDAFNITRTFAEEVVSDLSLCWKELTYLCSISFVFAIVMLVLLRYLAGLIIWVTLLFLSVASVAATVYIWLIWNYNKARVAELGIDDQRRVADENLVDKWFAGGLTASAFTLIFLLIVVVMRKRIQLVAMLFKEAGKAISDMPALLLQPIWTFILLCAVSLVWFYGLLFLQSTRVSVIDTHTNLVNYKLEPFYKYMKWYHMFAYLWTVHFVFSCQHFIIAGTVCYWFFDRSKRGQSCQIGRVTALLVRYHIGSMALGSLLVASVEMIRLLFKRVESLLNQYQTSCNRAIKCCRCCLWWFEKFIIYINKNAYIEIAIYGDSFCVSAQKAFARLSSNSLRLLALNSVGDFLLFLAKLFVVIGTVFIGIELIQEKSHLLHYYWSPIIAASLFAYFVSHTFLSVYEMVTDTLFMCFVEDCERNDGHKRPYFMSAGLMNFVKSSRRAMNELQNKL